MSLVYKICREGEWQEALALGVYKGSADDLRDGFIHLSAARQVRETARRHFAGQTDLLLVSFHADSLAPSLKWEPSRGGELFPHVYGTLDPSDAVWTASLSWHDGGHEFPSYIPA